MDQEIDLLVPRIVEPEREYLRRPVVVARLAPRLRDNRHRAAVVVRALPPQDALRLLSDAADHGVVPPWSYAERAIREHRDDIGIDGAKHQTVLDLATGDWSRPNYRHDLALFRQVLHRGQ